MILSRTRIAQAVALLCSLNALLIPQAQAQNNLTTPSVTGNEEAGAQAVRRRQIWRRFPSARSNA